MNRGTFIKCVKISAGSAIAIFIAEALGLEYATSAGIITLLTLQNTKRATLRLSIYRLLSFFVTMLAAGLMCTFGYHAAVFGVVMLIVTTISFYMGWGDTISTNAVFCTHLFMVGKAMTVAFLWNELQILVIGTAMAIILNWRMPNQERVVRKILEATEVELRDILRTISEEILTQEDSVSPRIKKLLKEMDFAQAKSVENMDNTLQSHSEFYIHYFDFRIQQCTVLLQFCRSVMSLQVVPEQAKHIARCVSVISDNFGLEKDVVPKLEMTKELLTFYQSQPLPVSRDEFEARALLFHGLKELEEFLNLKRHFLKQLTPEQIALYLDMQEENVEWKE